MTTIREAEPTEKNEGLLGPRTLELLGIQSLEDLRVITPWYHSGGETYCTDFVVQRGEKVEHLIAKACIKFGPREAVQEWLARRQAVTIAGAETPALFTVDGATIIEEFIPLTFREAYMQAEQGRQDKLRESFMSTVVRLHQAGFSPLSLHDVRSRGDDVVLIDFGSDLGPPYNKNSGLTSTIHAENLFRQLVK